MKATFLEFITRIKTVGLPSPTHFHIVIPGESKLNLMLCESITLPGFNVMTQEVRTFGELSELPHAPLYNAVTATFIMDNNAQPRTFFLDWLNQVYNRSTRQIGYYADYTKDIEIHITNKGSGTVLKTTLYECYPKSVQDVELSYQGDHIVKFTVQFIYKWAQELAEQSTGPTGTTGSGQQQNQPSAFKQTSNMLSGLPIGGIIASATQNIQNQITNRLPPGLIPEAQLEFNSNDLNSGFILLSGQINTQIGNSSNSLNQTITGLPTQVLSTQQNLQIQNTLLEVERGARLFQDAILNLQQDEQQYVDTFENRASIGDAIIELGQTMSQIENMLSLLDTPTDLQDFAVELGKIGLNIKTANQAELVNRQLDQFGQVFSAAGAELEIASNKIPSEYTTATRTGVAELQAQFMQTGLNISSLQAAI